MSTGLPRLHPPWLWLILLTGIETIGCWSRWSRYDCSASYCVWKWVLGKKMIHWFDKAVQTNKLEPQRESECCINAIQNLGGQSKIIYSCSEKMVTVLQKRSATGLDLQVPGTRLRWSQNTRWMDHIRTIHLNGEELSKRRCYWSTGSCTQQQMLGFFCF